jgi:hypothetical protein
MPSFCDRILYKSLPIYKENIKPLFFDSCEAANSSDHKPVRGGFEVNLTTGAHGILMNEMLIKTHERGMYKTSSFKNMTSKNL